MTTQSIRLKSDFRLGFCDRLLTLFRGLSSLNIASVKELTSQASKETRAIFRNFLRMCEWVRALECQSPFGSRSGIARTIDWRSLWKPAEGGVCVVVLSLLKKFQSILLLFSQSWIWIPGGGKVIHPEFFYTVGQRIETTVVTIVWGVFRGI